MAIQTVTHCDRCGDPLKRRWFQIDDGGLRDLCGTCFRIETDGMLMVPDEFDLRVRTVEAA